MNVNVSKYKSQFAALKYEQLLSDKYFIETCFSKKFESKSAQDKLKDLDTKIKINKERCEGISYYDCGLVCDTSTTTTTTLPESTTTTTTL
jgi:hypothetical protein